MSSVSGTPGATPGGVVIEQVGVIGAGTMGSGIAEVAALGGYMVTLCDVSEGLLERALARIEESLGKAAAKGRISEQDAQAALLRISTEPRVEAAAGEWDLAIEAAPEDMGIKFELFRTLDRLCRPTAIFASNTSGLSITEMAAACARPGRVAGMHFFNPVPRMKLVEIVRGLETDPATVAAVDHAARTMGKETVIINESPGFVTSRINALIGNEAFHMLEAGVATAEDIDRAVKLGLNHPMGPFEMIDMVGLDVRLAVLRNLAESLGDRYRPSPLLVKYVKAGRLGRKAGRGVYAYDAAGDRRPSV